MFQTWIYVIIVKYSVMGHLYWYPVSTCYWMKMIFLKLILWIRNIFKNQFYVEGNLHTEEYKTVPHYTKLKIQVIKNSSLENGIGHSKYIECFTNLPPPSKSIYEMGNGEGCWNISQNFQRTLTNIPLPLYKIIGGSWRKISHYLYRKHSTKF